MGRHRTIVSISILIALTICFALLHSLSKNMGTSTGILILFFVGLPFVILFFAIPYVVGCLFFDKPDEPHSQSVSLSRQLYGAFQESCITKSTKTPLSKMGVYLKHHKPLIYTIYGLVGGAHIGCICLLPVIAENGKIYGSAYGLFCYFPCFLVGLPWSLVSFHPETALFPNLCVNLHVCLCGVNSYASAQPLDFLDLGKNCSFPI